jgi:hypothetical protein
MQALFSSRSTLKHKEQAYAISGTGLTAISQKQAPATHLRVAFASNVKP